MTKSLRVLVHGAGWVSTQHIAALLRNPHTEVVGICSKTVDEARHRASEFGLNAVQVYEDLGKALDESKADVVVDLHTATSALRQCLSGGRRPAST